jgi:microcystin-dependent protein
VTRPRTTTSPTDALGATISDAKSRLVNLEALAHRHDVGPSALGPVGMIADYIGTTAPSGWAVMDGSTITGGQTLYPSLWAVLPSAFKSGADIVLPDTRGRVSVGRNPSDADFDNVGDTGGAKTVTLTTAQMPSHNHTQNAHGHSLGPGQSIGMSFGGNTGAFTVLIAQVAAINQGSYQGPYEAMANTATNNPEGGGGAHPNLQPYITFVKIIKLS